MLTLQSTVAFSGLETDETLNSAQIDQRARTLRDQLTLDEKISTSKRIPALCWVFDQSHPRRRYPGRVSTRRSTHKSFATCCFGSTTPIPAHRFTLPKTAPTSTTPCLWTAKFTTLGASNS